MSTASSDPVSAAHSVVSSKVTGGADARGAAARGLVDAVNAAAAQVAAPPAAAAVQGLGTAAETAGGSGCGVESKTPVGAACWTTASGTIPGPHPVRVALVGAPGRAIGAAPDIRDLLARAFPNIAVRPDASATRKP